MSAFKGFASKFKKNFFRDSMEYFQIQKTSDANGVTEAEVSRGQVVCAFYEAGRNEAIIADKLQTRIDCVAIHDPKDVSFTISDQDKCELVEKNRRFIVVHSDDIGIQNGGLAVYLKEDRRVVD